ncbi:signal peptidase I [Dictyobacter arantiisoli]|uniref:Signal peptidase I n=1 Tax=Dictyobacter arantiisoli TaxID=2014874 RepID=A0A5A5TCQ6_9CHLR|nr:signal peptidase I [Dictyobacter arantiisoli]GCF09300.1 signal peptidase I [Dictyobacter arantiisoli]
MSQIARLMRTHLWLHQMLETTALVCLSLLIIRVTVQDFYIRGHSMEPTLHDQESILVSRASYLFHQPARGDIIVFHYPLHPQDDYIKRVIAIPGDTISILQQTVIINGNKLNEKYIDKNDLSNPFPSFRSRKIGANQYFVMGDNRGSSSDSRLWGTVPRADIIGKAIIVYWPLEADNLGLLTHTQ